VRIVPDAIDIGEAKELRLDGVSGIYRLSQNVICVEFYVNKIVDGKVEKVVVLRNTWDRSNWLAAQQAMAAIFAKAAALPDLSDECERVPVH
jgi:hypothetical protein